VATMWASPDLARIRLLPRSPHQTVKTDQIR
jgi:hypothetical protein